MMLLFKAAGGWVFIKVGWAEKECANKNCGQADYCNIVDRYKMVTLGKE